MALIKDLAIGLSVNTGGFIGGMGRAGKALTGFGQAADQTKRSVNSMDFQPKGLGMIAAKVGAAAGAFGLPYKVFDFLKDGVMEASNLNEAVNKMGIIFGDSSATVQAGADEMAKRFGVVKSTFIGMSSTFGQLLTGMGGQSEKAAAETSVRLAKLVADAASVNNLEVEDVGAKVAAGLTGESEPIRSLGIIMQEAEVKAEGLRLGLIKQGQAMDSHAKVTARTSLIVKGLERFEKDLANTINEPANAMRRFQGNVTNMGAEIGAVFLPALQAGVGLLNEFTSWVMQAFADSKDTVKGWVDGFTTGIAYVGAAFRNLPAVWEIVKLSFLETTSNLLSIAETIPANLAIIGEWIANNWSQLIVDGVNVAISAFTNMGTNIGDLWTAIQGFLAGEGWNFEATPLLKGFEATAEALPELVKPTMVSMQAEIEKQWAILDADVAARTAKAGAVAEQSKPKLAGEDVAAADATKAGKEGPRFAGIALAGSVEAYQSQIRFAAMGEDRKDEPAKETAKAAKEQVDVSKQMLSGINKLVERGAGKVSDGAELFSL